MAGIYSQNQYTNNNWMQQNAPWNTMGVNNWSPFMNYSCAGNGNTTSSNKSANEQQAENIKKLKEAYKEYYQIQNQSTTFTGLNKQEEKIISDYNTKKQEYVEDFGAMVGGGLAFGVIMTNSDKLRHPISAMKAGFSSKSATNTIFKDIAKQDIWKKEAKTLQDAYAQMHKAEVRAGKWKWQGLFRRGYTKDEFNLLKDTMETAIRNGNKDEILLATEKLRQANGLKEGLWSKTCNWVKGLWKGTPSASKTVAERIADVKPEALNSLRNATNTSFKKLVRESFNLRDASGKINKLGIGMAAACLLSEREYISAAFKKDTSTGFKQLLQSVAKAGASWAGYALGEAAGKWAGAKLGMTIGSLICPGLGTAIGAVCGFIGGAVCSWGLRKVANYVVGDNVANGLINENQLAEAQASPEKNAAFLQNFVAQAEADKNIDSDTLMVVNKVKQMQALQAQQVQANGQQMQLTA